MSKCILLRSDDVAVTISPEDGELLKLNWFKDGRYTSHYFNGTKVALHRIVASRMTGLSLDELPLVEHLNDDPLDNRRDNLLVSSYQSNNLRRSVAKKSQAQKLRSGRFGASIWYGGKQIYLGTYDSKVLAEQIQQHAKESLLQLVGKYEQLSFHEVYAYFKKEHLL